MHLLKTILSALTVCLAVSRTQSQQITFPGASPGGDSPADSLESALRTAVDRDQLNRQSVTFYETLLFLVYRPQCSAPGGKPGTCGRLSSCPYLLPYVMRINERQMFEFVKQHICKIEGVIIYLCCPIAESGSPSQGSIQEVSSSRPPFNPGSIPSNPSQKPSPVPAAGGISGGVPVPAPSSTRPPSAGNGDLIPRQCGEANIPFIIGGEEFEQGTWPWLAAVGFPRRDGSFGLNCGGSLITRRHAITAAHCFIKQIPTHVRLGEHNLASSNDGARPMDFAIKARSNPGYNDQTKMNDIELLLLDKIVEFTDFVKPVCLPTSAASQANFERESFSIIGWGSIGEGTGTVTTPRFASISGVSMSSCRSTYASLVNLNPTTMVCAAAPGKDSCQGDSGGPLQHVNPTTGRYYVAGIVSFGKGCGRDKYPGVYTRVDAYLEWIRRTLRSLQ